MLLTIFKSTRSNDTITSNLKKKTRSKIFMSRLCSKTYRYYSHVYLKNYTRPFVHRLEILIRKMFWVFVGGGVGGWGLRIKVSGVGTLYYLQNDWNRMMTHIC